MGILEMVLICTVPHSFYFALCGNRTQTIVSRRKKKGKQLKNMNFIFKYFLMGKHLIIIMATQLITLRTLIFVVSASSAITFVKQRKGA